MTSVQEEVHLTFFQLLKMVLEGIYARCINCFLRKTVPSNYAPLREEVVPAGFLTGVVTSTTSSCVHEYCW